MNTIIQRVRRSSVTIKGKTVAAIGTGVTVLVCVQPRDTGETVKTAAAKIAKMRIFCDETGKMNRSLLDIGGEALVISQFTLCADIRKGNRPSFTGAAAPEQAETLYLQFAEELRLLGVPSQTGRFAAHMVVDIENDGPVTIPYSTE